MCNRCGYCCATMFIITIAPKYSEIESIDEFHKVIEEEKDNILISITNQDDKICPYLSWDEENDYAVCKIHHKEWFKELPCSNYRELTKCNIGDFINKREEIKKRIKERILSKI